MPVINGETEYGQVENRLWEVLQQVVATVGDANRGAIPIKIPSYTLGVHYGGYQAAVANTYAAGTNKITLTNACKHVVIYPTTDMYLVLDSAAPASDLADGAKRIFLPANKSWERSFSSGYTNLYFITTVAGVTGAVHVEAYT